MNRADSLWLGKIFEELGFAEADSLEKADVILINSCSVRQAAEDKVYGLAPRVSACRITHPALRIILTGCMVGSAMGKRRRIKLSDLKRKMPWVDYFIPPDAVFERLPNILRNGQVSEVGDVETGHAPSLQGLAKPGAVIISGGGGKEAYVPVMRGCDQFCSYCAVPYGRGPEMSRPMEEIVSEVEELVKRGVKKVTLLGQNVNSYGPPPFAKLLRRLHEIEGLEKIWFITSNPWDFSDDLVDALTLPKIEKYLHLPVQSGDDEILRRMNRPYTVREYKELVGKIRKTVPEVKLGTDIIVGFPGETEEQFQHTVDLVKEVGFSGAYVAMYSPRPGTAAAKLYEDDVPREEKRRRHKIILDLVRK